MNTSQQNNFPSNPTLIAIGVCCLMAALFFFWISGGILAFLIPKSLMDLGQFTWPTTLIWLAVFLFCAYRSVKDEESPISVIVIASILYLIISFLIYVCRIKIGIGACLGAVMFVGFLFNLSLTSDDSFMLSFCDVLSIVIFGPLVLGYVMGSIYGVSDALTVVLAGTVSGLIGAYPDKWVQWAENCYTKLRRQNMPMALTV